MHSEMEVITPERAKLYLDIYNTRNRKIKDKAILEYTYKMRNGLWDENNLDPIVITKDGILENGQHRLLSIIRSGKAIKMLVIRDAESAIGSYDCGVPRSVRDNLTIRGNLDQRLSQQLPVSLAGYMLKKNGIPRKNVQLTEKYINRFAEEIDIAYTAASMGTHNQRTITRNVGCMAAAYSALRNKETKEDVYSFFKIVSTGFYDYNWQTSAVILRDFLLNKNARSSNSQVFIEETRLVTENALYDYIVRKGRKNRYNTNVLKNIYLDEVIRQDKMFLEGVIE